MRRLLPTDLVEGFDLKAARAMQEHHEKMAIAWLERVRELERIDLEKERARIAGQNFRDAVDWSLEEISLRKIPADIAAELAGKKFDVEPQKVIAALQQTGSFSVTKGWRDRKIMEMRADGKSNTEIASAVGVHKATVGRVMARELKKTGSRPSSVLLSPGPRP